MGVQTCALPIFVFFFKQKTAYEIYQCDWSSDVCSSDLGATVKGINLNQLKSIKVPLPPLSQQICIIEILDKVNSMRRNRREANRLSDEFLKSTFLEMFGDPVENPKRYKIVAIKEECRVKGGKRLPKGEKFSLDRTNYPYIRVTDLKNYSVDGNNLKYLTEDIRRRIHRYIISKEDVYISIAGTIGLSGIVPDYLDGANLTENAARLIIRNRQNLNKIYLAYFLSSSYARQLIRQKTMAVGVPKLALFRIEELKLIIPPYPEQEKFAILVHKIEKLKEKQRDSKKELNNLFNSLMQKAFRGELFS